MMQKTEARRIFLRASAAMSPNHASIFQVTSGYAGLVGRKPTRPAACHFEGGAACSCGPATRVAYDEVMRGVDDGLVPRDEAQRIIRQPSADATSGDAWCRRCAGIYQPGVESCRGCGEFPLERIAASAPETNFPEPSPSMCVLPG